MANEKDDDVQKSMEKLRADGKGSKLQKNLDAFIDKVAAPGPNEEAFFEERRRKGLGVGLDENGNLISECDRVDKKPPAHEDD